MLDHHIEREAGLTVAAVPVPIEEASLFGIIEVDREWRMVGFEEKPEKPKEIPNRPGWALASMGNYIFNNDELVREIKNDAENTASAHDFGRNIITSMFERCPVYVYDFSSNIVPGSTEHDKGYWKDVGDIDTYWKAHMEMVAVTPVFNLYNYQWPIRTGFKPLPPAKFVFANEKQRRVGIATDSMVSEGCIISGGHINRSVLGPNVRINSFSYVTDCVLLEGVEVGRYAQIRNTIIDKHSYIGAGVRIGYDLEEDRKRFTVTPSGIVVIPRQSRVEK
jgi:glucose-1-phosphate adenylyltransferase